MELAAPVPLRLSPTILRLARAELPKILCGLWHNILEQLHFDPPELLPCSLMSVTDHRDDGLFCPEVHKHTAKKRRVVEICAG